MVTKPMIEIPMNRPEDILNCHQGTVEFTVRIYIPSRCAACRSCGNSPISPRIWGICASGITVSHCDTVHPNLIKLEQLFDGFLPWNFV